MLTSDEPREKAGQPCDAMIIATLGNLSTTIMEYRMSYKNKPLATLIASYKTQPQPYSNYLSNLEALATSMQELRTGENLEDEAYYTYVLVDPRFPGRWQYALPSGRVVSFPYRPYYVGKGKGARSKAHTRETGTSHKHNVIRAIRSAGFDPCEYIRHSSDPLRTDALSKAYEIDLIAGIGRFKSGGPLTNGTDGGDGAVGSLGRTGHRHSDHTKALMRKARLGTKMSAAAVEKSRAKNLGRVLSQEHRDKVSAALRGVAKSKEHAAKVGLARAKPIMVEGKIFLSYKQVLSELRIGYAALRTRLASVDWPNYVYYQDWLNHIHH